MSIKDELQDVEADLTRLRAEERETRQQIGEMGATDQVEISAMISQADETVQLIAGLERHRDRLLEQLEGEKGKGAP
ncbi:hypothetical protein SAMN05444920_12190 [Nonomuraea solani]|uniref:Uncharacterized protein n=1 Tax=Nonomuraea solani TaxID=1144553 RepID=A0A1H6EV45_9ACTN|nr:hypothetical protein [Nonomuraea solani]SEH01642.1 hypothetical protein SAMN05444920_12190 [Nonomuraea solani]